MKLDEIIEMAKQAGLLDMDYEIGQWEIHEFTIFAKLVAEAEREACAEVCLETYPTLEGAMCASRIRARGEA